MEKQQGKVKYRDGELHVVCHSLLETILSDMNRADIILSVLTVTCAQCAHFPRVRTQVLLWYWFHCSEINILFDFITIVLGFWENDKNDKKLTPNEIILKHNICLSSTHFSSTADLSSLFSSPISSIFPHTSSCADTCTPVSALQRWSFLQISSSCQQTWKLSCSHSPASNLCHSYGRGWKILSTHSVEVLLQFQWVVYSLC